MNTDRTRFCVCSSNTYVHCICANSTYDIARKHSVRMKVGKACIQGGTMLNICVGKGIAWAYEANLSGLKQAYMCMYVNIHTNNLNMQTKRWAYCILKNIQQVYMILLICFLFCFICFCAYINASQISWMFLLWFLFWAYIHDEHIRQSSFYLKVYIHPFRWKKELVLLSNTCLNHVGHCMEATMHTLRLEKLVYKCVCTYACTRIYVCQDIYIYMCVCVYMCV